MRTIYLLGAGASANALPVLNNFEVKINDSLKDLRSRYQNDETVLGRRGGYVYRARDFCENVSTIYGLLRKEVEKSKVFESIDQLAKSYLDSENYTGFQLIKHLLQVFFLTEEYVLNRIENRYNGLFVKLYLKGEIKSQIDFVTWNYDNQLMKVFHKYTQSNARAHIINTPDWYAKPLGFKESRPFVYPLNGRSYDHELAEVTISDVPGYCSDLSKVANRIADISQGLNRKSEIRYAFEGSHASVQLMLEHLTPRAMDAETLVIIGYTFPNFNRDIDEQFFKLLLSLKRIVIQVIDIEEFERIKVEVQKILSRCHPYRDQSSYSLEYKHASVFFIADFD